MVVDFLQNLMLLIKVIGAEDTVKAMLINLSPGEMAFNSLLDTTIDIWAIYLSYISLYSWFIIIGLFMLVIMLIIETPASFNEYNIIAKTYSGLYNPVSGTTMFPGLRQNLVAPQQKIAVWLINIFTKPLIFIILATISAKITIALLVDPEFVTLLFMEMVKDPFMTVSYAVGSLFAITVIFAVSEFIIIAGLLAYGLIEAGNVNGSSFTKGCEIAMYTALIVSPATAFFYRISWIMQAEGNGLYFIAFAIITFVVGFYLLAKGIISALVSLAMDIVLVKITGAFFGKGVLAKGEVAKLLGIKTTLGKIGTGASSGKKLPTEMLTRPIN